MPEPRLFDRPGPRVFGLPPGVDGMAELARGLAERLAAHPPEAWGRVTVWLPTRRMQRHLEDLLSRGGARLLPRLRLVSEVGLDPAGAGLPPPVPALRRRLELATLIAALLDRQPDLAPRARLFDLADSLAGLMEEMQGEGVPPATIRALDVSDQSGHWARALAFLQILAPWFEESGAPDGEARARRVADRLARLWRTAPPADPVIVAGSTGARGATAVLMEAVARLPQGAVVLPGFDADLPGAVWETLADPLTTEDHPQSRAAVLLARLGLRPDEVRRWTDAGSPCAVRAKLVSLALRPPPVTDQWRAEGPGLGDLGPACARMTLLEAPSPRAEAEAIALRLRHAVDQRITAAVVTPDRTLARMVAAALDRWDVVPDDSAGEPLGLSPPGRLLRQVADLRGRAADPPALLALLKHPLVHAAEGRGRHLDHARRLELALRRRGPALLAPRRLRAWGEDHGCGPWADWLAGVLERLGERAARGGRHPLAEHVAAHVALAEALSLGPEAAEGAPNPLWAEAAGRAALAAMGDLARHAGAGGPVTARDHALLLDGLLAAAEVRRPDRGHPQVMIWGTQEAQGQGAELVILAGLNDGAWPTAAAPDPWLNRALRAQAGLPLPERRIGGLALDFQQAANAPEVWLTRAVRTDEAPTTPSRWLNRLTNLLDGLPDQGGRAGLAGMRARARPWLDGAQALNVPAGPIPRAPRPAPSPPVALRPQRLSVTRVEALLRDPYAVYVHEVLRLRPLDPLTPEAGALERGTHLHKAMERFADEHLRGLEGPLDPAAARAALLGHAAAVLEAECGWPVHRRLWLAALDRAADAILAGEAERMEAGRPHLLEATGEVVIGGVTITARADRIDRGPDGRIRLIDYKTGKPPSKGEQEGWAKQLLIEVVMAGLGAFRDLGPAEVAGAVYVGLGSGAKVVPAPMDAWPAEVIRQGLEDLFEAWRDPTRGYAAHLATDAVAMRRTGDTDHLARFGEWDHATEAVVEPVGHPVTEA